MDRADGGSEGGGVIAPNVSVEEADASRLMTQAEKILARLQRGDKVPTGELAAIARQYNARIFELRKAGYSIELVDRNYDTGETWYQLAVNG